MNENRTKGPWKVVTHPGGKWTVQGADNIAVAQQYGDAPIDDAFLIAASPEQNAELIKLAEDLQAHTKDGLGATAETLAIWEARVRAVIAKSTGRN